MGLMTASGFDQGAVEDASAELSTEPCTRTLSAWPPGYDSLRSVVVVRTSRGDT